MKKIDSYKTFCENLNPGMKKAIYDIPDFLLFNRVCKGKLKAKGELSAKEVSDVSLYSIYRNVGTKYISVNA